jgi:hypothetical protein
MAKTVKNEYSQALSLFFGWGNPVSVIRHYRDYTIFFRKIKFKKFILAIYKLHSYYRYTLVLQGVGKISKGGISMITVFDVATHEELIEMFGFGDDEYDKEELLELIGDDPDFNNGKLAVLYYDRGDIRKSEEHLALIKNNEYRQETAMLIYEIKPIFSRVSSK